MIKDDLIRAALDAGATNAVELPTDGIVFSESFRAICKKNSCGVYGKCWACPPDCGEIAELMERVRTYDAAVLYQTIGEVEDSFDFEGMQEVRKAHARTGIALQKHILTSYGKGMLHLSAGGCGVCPVCAKVEELPCRAPELAMISLEACGIDVYNTVRCTPLKYINGKDTVTYFGLILYHDEA